MKKIKLLLFLFYCSLSLVVAQEYYYAAYNQSVTHPTPTSSGLGKYVEIPVGKYTGVVENSIPIFTITTGNITLPISLSYHSSGIKLEEPSSWVGLGWSLNAGGAIVRVVNDLYDEKDSNAQEGYLTNPGYLNDALSSIDLEELTVVWRDHDVYRLGDFEPDLFYYNFNGNNGKFVYDENGIPLPITQRNIEIDETIQVIDNRRYITKFNIILENGTKYYFNKYELVTSKTYTKYGMLNEENIRHPIDTNIQNASHTTEKTTTAWYLTKIEDVNGNDVNFIYEDEKYTDYTKGHTFSKDAPDHFTIDFLIKNSPIYQTHEGQRLSKITWSGGYIDFDATHYRKDLIIVDAMLAPRALTNVSIYNNIDVEPIKSFDFNYSYFKRDEQDNEFDEMKLRLDEIREVSESTIKESYKFEYELFFRSRFSYCSDYWGFPTILTGSGSIFKTNVYAYDFVGGIFSNVYSILHHHGPREPRGHITDGVDRYPYFPWTKSCMLKKITYMTGGFSEFIYEPNEFHLEGYNFIGGGLRIKEIRHSKNKNKNSDIIKRYSYKIGDTDKSSGKIISLPNMARKIRQNDSEFEGNPIYYTSSFTALTGTNGSFIGYTEVTEEIISNTENGETTGKIVSFYSCPASFEDENAGCFTVPGGHEVCIYEKTKTGAIIGRDCLMRYNEHDLYTLVSPPNPNYDFNRGFLLSEIYYDNQGDKIKEIINTYNTPETWENYRKIPAVRTAFSFLLGPRGHEYVPYAQYYFFTNWRYLTETKEIVYDRNNESNKVEKTTSYTYHTAIDAKHKQPIIIKNNNYDGSFLSTTYTYPTDYDINENATEEYAKKIKNLQQIHVFDKPIEIISKQNNKFLGGTILNYDYDANLSSVYVADFEIPQSSFNISHIAGGSFVKDSEYKLKTSFIEYDTRGNILEFKNTDDITISAYWAYDSNYPVVKAENATYQELFVAVQSALSNSGIAEFDNITDFSNSLDKSNWKIFNETIRTELPNANISTYTYKPLVGMTSFTGIDENTIFYEYDKFGRLETIRNKDNNIIKHIDYEYDLSSQTILPPSPPGKEYKRYEVLYTPGKYCTVIDEWGHCDGEERNFEGEARIVFKITDNVTGISAEYSGSLGIGSPYLTPEEEVAYEIAQLTDSQPNFPNLFVGYNGEYFIFQRIDNETETNMNRYSFALISFTEWGTSFHPHYGRTQEPEFEIRFKDFSFED